ncbi:MAG: PQQ-dependent dehydrogenase, methanol/ethanol family [Deltaproteobacteria bacterium]|nr:PQQ-dependent dehydrogenase, methanol/ethanol family [Deltaproteobacteria bacterium]
MRGRRYLLVRSVPFVVSTLLAVGGCDLLHKEPSSTVPAPAKDSERRAAADSIDAARLRAAASEPQNWLTHGGTYAEQRFSPLDQINDGNVQKLGLAWSYDTNTTRGLEATPLVVDGVIYTTGSWSIVYAIDARNGNELWKYDPQVPRETGPKACCDVVNRGVALYKGKVFVGTLDGRLVALDAGNGKPVWEVVTVDQSRPYTITGAPRVVEGKVIIGNGGAELGVRGYVSAYDSDTGKMAWRFYTVPGDPSQPFESPALERAARTWKGGEWWKVGGGGTVWDSMAYDPDLHLLYIGTGNGSPWSRFVRSPGGGDNLYLSSILALNPTNGELVWYYQETPGDTWDFTATQHIILAELPIKGRLRKVILHAPKNGFFYVIDRQTGELLSAEKFVEATWADRVDLKTGRPVLAKGTDYRDKTVVVKPSPHGAHNWQPMSFNPKTGLVYIPTHDIPMIFGVNHKWKYRPGHWNTGTDFTLIKEVPRNLVAGALLAWDPVRQKEVWRAPYKGPWNGGTLTTAGNLVFQGTADGRFVAYRADNGTKLWEAPSGSGIVAAPVTYSVDGEQYVAVMAGWGGAFALAAGDAAAAAGNNHPIGRLLTFKLNGAATLPAAQKPRPPLPATAAPKVAHAVITKGEDLYAIHCQVCHGSGATSGGVLPDLRYVAPAVQASINSIVLDGALRGNGMPAFRDVMNEDDVAAILAYVQQRAADAAK